MNTTKSGWLESSGPTRGAEHPYEVNVSRYAARKLQQLLSLVSFLSLCFEASAHHGQSLFERQSQITLDGIVTRYEWANPHVYVYVELEDDSGDRAVWEVEGQPPTILKRQGWSPDTLQVGDHVIVNAFPPRNPIRRIALGVTLETANGDRLALGFNPQLLSDTNLPRKARADGLSGTWSTILERSVAMPILVGPAARQDLPNDDERRNRLNWDLTEQGLQSVEEFRQESMLPGIECTPYPSPFLMVLPDVKVIEVEDDVVRIRSEFEGIERTVHMNVDSHDRAEFSLQGHSIGRWDGAALVVDTSHFAEHRVGNAMGVPSSTSKHLVERLSLNADGVTLTYRFELEDPEYLASPVTGEIRWTYAPDMTYAPEECDLENARRFIGD
jgi:hypothetical protein